MKVTMPSICNCKHTAPAFDDGFDKYLELLSTTAKMWLTEHPSGLFTTKASENDLFALYLRNIKVEVRQTYNCNACRHFVNRFGGLVVIDELTGKTFSPFWTAPATSVPVTLRKAFQALAQKVAKSPVTGVFYPATSVIGEPFTGTWKHLSCRFPAAYIKSLPESRLQTNEQIASGKKEDFRILKESRKAYSLKTVRQAVTLLRTDSLNRSEKFIDIAKWFEEIQDTSFEGTAGNNMLWCRVVKAPKGFCHIKSSMIGTLLDDLEAGLPLEVVKRKFAEKTQGDVYMRPQALPDAGNVKRAEQIFEKLGLEEALHRRYATLDECEVLWKSFVPKSKQPSSGIFASVPVKQKVEQTPLKDRTPIVMTWEKFTRTVLPTAEKIQLMVPGGQASFGAYVTAENPFAPPLLQWDSEKSRNQTSWYVYHMGSLATNWNLQPYMLVNVLGISPGPHMWEASKVNGDFSRHAKGALLILEGARDLRAADCGLAIFPETLRGDLHEVRSTIEAYSRKGTLGQPFDQHAAGLLLSDKNAVAELHVTSGGVQQTYKIDRWD